MTLDYSMMLTARLRESIQVTIIVWDLCITNHALLEVTNILFSTSTNFHRNLLMCSSVKSMKLSQ